MKKNLILYFIIAILISATILIFISSKFLESDINNRYSSIVNNIQLETKTLIEQKKEATLMVALSLSKDYLVKKSLLENNFSLLSLNEISYDFNTFSNFKNVWFHIVTKDGMSFIKSWTPKKGENIINIRKDIKNLLKYPKTLSVISVGKYDMTIKAIVPIYNNKKFLGLFEVITKVNSIAKALKKDNIDSIILADKKYTKQLKFPFTKKFINGYYVANINAKDKLLKILKDNDIEKIIQKDYNIIDNYLVVTYNKYNTNGKKMGYFLLFKSLNNIDISDIKQKQINFVLTWLSIAGVLFTILFLFLYYSYNSLLQKQVNKKTKELNNINNTLMQRIDEETKKNIEYEKKYFQQKQIIDMNALLKNIGHHWRQPLSVISTSASGVKLNLEYGIDDKEDISLKMDIIVDSAEILSDTINYFTSSIEDKDDLKTFKLTILITKIKTIIDRLLKENNIDFNIKIENKDLELTTFETKLINIILSLITNAKDILNQRDIINKTICLSIYEKNDFLYIEIIDNAGGIDLDIIDKIFEPYFTTQHQSLNKGLSLYLNYSTVKESLKGDLLAVNSSDGAKFTIKIPYISII